ncbi:hypothetical protein, conserved [Trypanosoma brucei brucei TREU927]|uniref:RRM domain-containing protein n=1 Tax=Trypanosoma brucei brucei (strain 927/4 GUTat10.1) TaxID=185431 RepID=Q57U22_TRYB2|nr:hypothetical protein, conserved [Trypanosoma brucei brucei TREU927]AAX70896.1 hypothetical protein, conserved [Trypanosoma brucei]AAZ12097.1 hypothetical protein, conserved [Trypanosoma brucei brucei TREU927]
MYTSGHPSTRSWGTEGINAPLQQKATYSFPLKQPRRHQQQQQQQQTLGRQFDAESTHQASPTAAKLFVGQLPFETDEKRLYDLFSAYGTVEHIHILRDSQNRSKGAAFVTYSNVEEADTAIFTLHNRYKMLANRMIQVSYAKNSANISLFGACNAIAVHRMNPTNPVPDMANVTPESRVI